MAGAVTSTASSASGRAESKSHRACRSLGQVTRSRHLPRTSDDTSCLGHRSSFTHYKPFLSRLFFFLPSRLHTQRKPRAGSQRGINWWSSTSLQGVSRFTPAWSSQSPLLITCFKQEFESLCWSPREPGCSTGFFFKDRVYC